MWQTPCILLGSALWKWVVIKTITIFIPLPPLTVTSTVPLSHMKCPPGVREVMGSIPVWVSIHLAHLIMELKKNIVLILLLLPTMTSTVLILAVNTAWSVFWETIVFNFERPESHHNESDRKSNVAGVLGKNESFNWNTFHPDLSYHSGEMISE